MYKCQRTVKYYVGNLIEIFSLVDPYLIQTMWSWRCCILYREGYAASSINRESGHLNNSAPNSPAADGEEPEQNIRLEPSISRMSGNSKCLIMIVCLLCIIYIFSLNCFKFYTQYYKMCKIVGCFVETSHNGTQTLKYT